MKKKFKLTGFRTYYADETNARTMLRRNRGNVLRTVRQSQQLAHATRDRKTELAARAMAIKLCN